MRFSDFDKKMRIYEENMDQVILSDMYIIARLDGRTFSKMTLEENFQKPFDIRFRDLMKETTENLMTESGFRIIYGYTESDEISLLFHPEDRSFGRKVRKINSTLAAQASAFLSLKLGKIVTFDCRVIPLPNMERVLDYFSWRQEDAHRNSLNGWCYWTLRQKGKPKREATAALKGKGVSFKNELLFKHGINYNDLPAWQKRGIGLYYANTHKEGYDPIAKKTVQVVRRKLFTDYNPETGEKYREFIKRGLTDEWI